MKRHYTLAELEALPTLAQGQADDLKIETATRRIWLSRMTVADGMEYDNQVSIEEYRDDARPGRFGSWVIVETYQAK